jgi:tetratricopeptide (TPR) repeat protein
MLAVVETAMNLSVVTLAALLFAGPQLAEAPDDLESSYQNLKQAEASNDAVKVKELAAQTCALARKVASEPAPDSEDAMEAWKQKVAHAKDVDKYSEYALYAVAIKAQPATTIELLTALEQQNPKSQYLDSAYANYIYALHQTGAAAKIVPLAEKAIVNFPNNPDLLLVLADSSLTRKQNDRALAYSQKLIGVLSARPRPEKSASLGRAYWISGMILADKTRYFDADKSLRAALPLIKGNEVMYSNALFQLGVANYQLATMTHNKVQLNEAIQFSEEVSKMNSPLAQQAWRNVQAMKAEAVKIR